ncbi:MAG: thymidylate synthase [Erysipelotrichaceae bacterium]|nr:thymidylate synthase [Erysipelotrichaceae bacterium]
MRSYLDMVDYVLKNGQLKDNRTGIKTLSVSGYMFRHNMSEGFPLLTSKKIKPENVFSELEFFIKGITSKKWLQERNNHIWDEWCSPEIIPYSTDPEVQEKMREEDYLGPIYGSQWRNFNGDGYDQLKNLIDTIKTNPESRRMIVSAWNPAKLDKMALPPCHVMFQILINTTTKKMDLIWYQRSCDLMLGIPYNIASYACLLCLIAKETGYTPNELIGSFADLHIYENHIEKAKIQLQRPTHPLPQIEFENFTSIFDWKYEDTKILNYEHEGFIKFPVAV